MNPPNAARERAALLADAPRSGLFRGRWGSQFASNVVDAVVRTALPSVCAGCGVSGHWICPICDQHIRRINLDSACRRCGGVLDDGAGCDRCAGWSPAILSCRSAYVFDGAVRKTIHHLKYHGEFARAEWCGREVARLVNELGWRPDLLVPVPLHRSRLRSRGYNQSAKIASVAAVSLATPFGNVLVRTRATLAQVGLDAAGRRENVQGAFACPHDLSDLSILLVDDVVTTGATIEACAVACRQAGAQDIWAVTVATGT